MIKLTRIDDRLLHGQVSFTWIPALGVDCVVLANDAVAKDEFQKMALGLAKPPTVKLFIKTIADTILFLNDEKNARYKMLILINSVKDAATLTNAVSEIRSVNFGGIRGKDGSKLISKAIAITPDDVPLLKDMIGKGVELEIRQVPTDSKQLVATLLET